MTDLTKFVIKAYVRKGLAILGTYLITHGLIAGDAESFAGQYVDEVVGFVLVTGSTAWTTIYQFYVRRKVVTALKMEPGTGPARLEAETAAALYRTER